MRVPKVDPRHAIVTGASTGIGAATALCLRDAGWTVLPTVRNSDDARRLRGEGFTPLILDLADPVSVAAAAEEALNSDRSRFGSLLTYEVARREANPDAMRPFTLPPEAVARRILHAVSSSRPRRRYPVTVQAVAGEWARRLLPDATVDGILRHALRRKIRAARVMKQG